MKKIAKLSLVASIAVASLTSAHAESLAEAFAASKVKGEIKSLYFQKETNAGVKSSIWTNGGNLSLKTGSYNGLSAGVTFQTAHVANIDDNAGKYASDMDVSGSIMSEAYLAYTLNNTTLKAGRQYISTPLVAGSGSRILKQSFEGYVLANTDLPNTTLVAAYVTKYQNRTDGNGGVPSFEQVADGAYTIYAQNKSVENLMVEAQYAQIKAITGNDTKAFYAHGAYKLSPITAEFQTYQTDNGSTDANGEEYGVKVSAKVAGLTAAAAYTTTDKGQKVVAGLGSGADKIFTASPIAAGNYAADTNAYKLDLGYKIADLGLSVSYTNWDTNGSDWSETNLTASYKFNKNFSTKVMYSSFDNASYDYRSRVYVSYKF